MDIASNTKQQLLGLFQAIDTPHPEKPTSLMSRHDSPPKDSSSMAEKVLAPTIRPRSYQEPANIIRESIEVEDDAFNKPNTTEQAVSESAELLKLIR
ncbi:hypothetical protein S7711_09286 [Stachybotrys chartarum IBT 7711]|uniref:Uncharacterized protein n=1 Tax=Stachybotrys chartarum (strain CBS 109288 / IBT 7711) TaxID=1280523 RepID=A0A084AJL6_STACB|nr:hypothetical protein S7711_09286 [Stachybotrys chartarum IBT 7711]